MSEWSHSWAYPFILVVYFEGEEGQAPRRIMTLAQECLRCGARRNPVSGGFHSWGTNARAMCHAPKQSPEALERERDRMRNNAKILEHLEGQLKAMRDDGWTVLPRWAQQQKAIGPGSSNRELDF